MIFIFATFLLIIAFFMLWQRKALFTLLPNNQKNQTFIHVYISLLFFIGIVGLILGFFTNQSLTFLYVGVVLFLSGLFTASFAKRMKK